MIFLRDFEDVLKRTGEGYFIRNTRFVPDIVSWAEENNHDLSEPHHPMKLITESDNSLSMIMQSEVSEKIVDDVIRNLAIRWSVKDNSTDIEKKLDSIKKRLLFCFLKERARTMKGVGGTDLVEDQWVFDEMQLLGFFDEYEEM